MPISNILTTLTQTLNNIATDPINASLSTINSTNTGASSGDISVTIKPLGTITNNDEYTELLFHLDNRSGKELRQCILTDFKVSYNGTQITDEDNFKLPRIIDFGKVAIGDSPYRSAYIYTDVPIGEVGNYTIEFEIQYEAVEVVESKIDSSFVVNVIR